MKNLKQIREQNEVIVEAEESDRNLTSLVRSGLYDSKKISMLKRALDKDNAHLNTQERKALLDLLDNLLSQVVSNKSVYSKVKQNLRNKENVSEEKTKDNYSSEFQKGKIPALLILKRKSIRQFPDGTVALYYSDKLNKYISIPFSPEIGIGSITEETKPYDDIKGNVISYLKNLEESENLKFEDDTVLLMTNNMAKKIVGIYESLNKTNKQQMLNFLSEDKNSFLKIVNFALNK